MADPMPRIQGYCPMGCGETLFVGADGWVTCSWLECPNPSAVADILQDPETEHIVILDAETFSIQHPLRERLNGELFDCGLHQWIAELPGPPMMPGRYRVREDKGQWLWLHAADPVHDARAIAEREATDE